MTLRLSRLRARADLREGVAVARAWLAAAHRRRAAAAAWRRASQRVLDLVFATWLRWAGAERREADAQAAVARSWRLRRL